VRESELLIVPQVSQRQHNFERGKGQYFHRVSEGEKERRLRKRYKLQTVLGTSEETMPESQAGEDCECLWKKMIGKPYSGKSNVRLCVQRRLVCSAGDSPAMARVRSHVVRMAG